MIEAEWWDYDDADELADAVAGDVAFVIESALDARGSSLIALPGGTTPGPVYDRLAAMKIKWKYVTIIPTDDRLVPIDNPLSNAAMLARAFMPKGARVVPTAGDLPDHIQAGNAANARLNDLPWPPDLVWLGMGSDGHTASIFAGPDLDAALDGPAARRAVGVMPDPLPPEAPVARVTLTAAAIAAARTLTIVLTGADKRRMLEQAIRDGASSPLPVGRVLAKSDQPVDIHWCP